MFCADEPATFVRSKAPTTLLDSSAHFGDNQFGIDIVHQFGGHQPILLNYEAFTSEICIPFRPTAILDSNVVNYLHQYVSSKSALESHRREVIADLLRFLVAKGLDYNPFFYYLEGATKGEQQEMLGYAREVSESILRLHTMDKEQFLATGNIVIDPELLALYATEYEATTIEEITPRYAQAMARSDPHMEMLSKLVYASLLKMGYDPHAQPPRGTREVR